jgi:hypothetical protein
MFQIEDGKEADSHPVSLYGALLIAPSGITSINPSHCLLSLERDVTQHTIIIDRKTCHFKKKQNLLQSIQSLPQSFTVKELFSLTEFNVHNLCYYRLKSWVNIIKDLKIRSVISRHFFKFHVGSLFFYSWGWKGDRRSN